MSPIFVAGIKMQGYLNKKSEKNKKWKSLYFVLLVDGTDTHLYFYDNPKVCKFMLVFSLRSVKHQKCSTH
jgi:hypothetical protein